MFLCTSFQIVISLCAFFSPSVCFLTHYRDWVACHHKPPQGIDPELDQGSRSTCWGMENTENRETHLLTWEGCHPQSFRRVDLNRTNSLSFLNKQTAREKGVAHPPGPCRPIELSAMVEVFSICMVQCGRCYSTASVATERLNCGLRG